MHSQRNPDISYFARTDFRGVNQPFGIRQADRLSHCYVVGKTGVGKSTLLAHLVRQDIEHGRGLALLDPHGDLVADIEKSLTEAQRERVTYLNAPDRAMMYGFNPLERVEQSRQSLAAGGVLEAFKTFWADSWGPRLEHILRNALFALIEIPETTLADIPRLLEDKTFRTAVAAHVQNERVRHFWLNEFAGYPARLRAEAIAPLQNKVGAFLTDPVLRRILTEFRKPIRFRRLMDERRILLVNLAKGRIGEDTSSLLGSLLLSRFNVAALSRADAPESQRPPFHCVLDEFQNFASLGFLSMLSELRKYGIGIVLAHQYLDQLDPHVREAALGNAGTLITFRVGAADAEFLAKELYPRIRASDITNLPNHHIYLKLMIDGMVSQPFSAVTLPPEG